jgi:hypothetical protein
MRLSLILALACALSLAGITYAAAPVTVLVDPTTYVLIRPTATQLANANNLGGGGGGGGSYIFTATDFNESGSTVSLDFTNAQKATSSVPGFLSAADWVTFNAKASTSSPTFTGTPIAPTAAVDTNTTQIATTAFVVGQSYLKASTAAATYQTLDSDLTAIAALATTSFGRSLLTQSSAATIRAALDLEAGTDFLAYPSGTPNGNKFLRDDNTWVSIAGGGDALVANPLSQFAATTSAQLAGVLSDEAGASGGFVRTGYLGTAATEASTAFQAADGDLTTYANITPSANVQSLLGAADYSAMRTQLSLVPGTNVQAYDADLATYAGITPSANIQTLLGAADYAAMRTQLGLVIGTNVQAYDADLATWSGVTPGSGVATFLATPSSTNFAAAITGETGTGAVVLATSPTLVTPVLGVATATSFATTQQAHGNAGSTETFDRANGDTHTATLDANLTVTLTGWSSSGTLSSMLLGLTQDGTGGRTVTWPGSVVAAPTVTSTASAITWINLWTVDGGSTVYATSTATASGGDGDFSSNTATSVDSEFVIFSGTGGKTGKRATGTGIARGASGVASFSEISGDATTSGSNALTLATVNSNVGTFGSATAASTITVNAKGLVTAASNTTITPAVGSITGLGTGVSTALAVNAGSTGAFLRNQDRVVTFVLTIDDLANSLNYDIGFVGAAFTVTEIRGVHFGSGLSSPSIVATVKHGTDRTSGTTIEAVTATSSTTGTSVTTGFDDATVPANSFIWIETGSKSGTTDNFTIIVRGTYD